MNRIYITRIQLSYYPVYTKKNLISVRPKIRLRQDEPAQVHMRGTNPRELLTVTRIVSGIFLAMINIITYLLNFLTEKIFSLKCNLLNVMRVGHCFCSVALSYPRIIWLRKVIGGRSLQRPE